MRTFKKRPVIVVAMSSLNTMVVCQITSKNNENLPAVPLQHTDFLSGSLAISSFVRPDKLFTIDRVGKYQVLGQISENKLKKIKQQIIKIFD